MLQDGYILHSGSVIIRVECKITEMNQSQKFLKFPLLINRDTSTLIST